MWLLLFDDDDGDDDDCDDCDDDDVYVSKGNCSHFWTETSTCSWVLV